MHVTGLIETVRIRTQKIDIVEPRVHSVVTTEIYDELFELYFQVERRLAAGFVSKGIQDAIVRFGK